MCGSEGGALRGLTILAAGKHKAQHVNLAAFVDQARTLDTGFMTLGRWLSGYPPLCERIAAVGDDFDHGRLRTGRGAVRASMLVFALFIAPFLLVGGLFAVIMLPTIRGSLDELALAQQEFEDYSSFEVEDVDAALAQAHSDLEKLGNLVTEFVAANGEAPEEINALEPLWESTYPGVEFPMDPFDGVEFGYLVTEGEAFLWSSGPDGESATDDDIDYTIELVASGGE